MSLKEKILNDLTTAIKNKKDVSDYKVIVGEIQRLPEKDPNDESVLKVLNKLIKYEKENLNINGNQTSRYLQILESYTPTKVSNEEIESWIRNNINFGELKNKMMSIKIVLNHFGINTDGDTVKKILMEKF
jgi:uncharacterized protein YqeY